MKESNIKSFPQDPTNERVRKRLTELAPVTFISLEMSSSVGKDSSLSSVAGKETKTVGLA